MSEQPALLSAEPDVYRLRLAPLDYGDGALDLERATGLAVLLKGLDVPAKQVWLESGTAVADARSPLELLGARFSPNVDIRLYASPQVSHKSVDKIINYLSRPLYQ